MRQTEELDLIPDDQNGSRKKRRSVLTALNKVIVTDIYWQMRLPLSMTNNDAQACYDRIVIWIQNLRILSIDLWTNFVFDFDRRRTES